MENTGYNILAEKLTVQQVAPMLGVHVNTLMLWLRTGQNAPKSFKSGKKYIFLESDVRDWLEKQRVN